MVLLVLHELGLNGGGGGLEIVVILADLIGSSKLSEMLGILWVPAVDLDLDKCWVGLEVECWRRDKCLSREIAWLEVWNVGVVNCCGSASIPNIARN